MKLCPSCFQNLSQIFQIEISCAQIQCCTLHIDAVAAEDDNNPTIVYTILFKRISDQVFNFISFTSQPRCKNDRRGSGSSVYTEAQRGQVICLR